MTLFYSSTTWEQNPKPNEKTVKYWEQSANKSNWRIVELPNGFYQTECKNPDTEEWVDVTRRETIEGAEKAIDKSIEYFKTKLSFVNGPKVVKTF